MATCCQIDRIVEARLDHRITNAIMNNFWRIPLRVIEKLEINETTTLSIPERALISKIQFNILMELTMHGSRMIQFPIVTQHHSFSRKISKKKYYIQIGVMQTCNRFSSIRKHFRISFVMTNHMSTHEN